MTSFTTLVNVDAEAIPTLINFVSRQLGADGAVFGVECNKLLVAVQPVCLTSKILEQATAIFSLDNDKDVEACIQGIVLVMLTVGDGSENIDIVRNVIAAVTSTTESQQKTRLNALLILFNIISIGQSKYDILTAIFKYAMATSQTSSVCHFNSNVDNWTANWNISVQDKRALYRLVSEFLTIDNKTALSLQYLIRYFKTFSGAALPEDVAALAEAAVVDALKSDVSADEDRNSLLQSVSLAQSKGDLAVLLELLQIICCGDLATFTTFTAQPAHATLLAARGVDLVDTLHTMKLLVLCSLGSQNASLSYSSVAIALGVACDDVEGWVVDAISCDLVEATLDQCCETVKFGRCMHRSFGLENWRQLSEKLRLLRANVAVGVEASTRTHKTA